MYTFYCLRKIISEGVHVNAQEAHTQYVTIWSCAAHFIIMIYWPIDPVYEQLNNLLSWML